MEQLPLTEYFIDPNRRLFWLYLLSSFAISVLYLALAPKQRRRNATSKLWLHPSAILDYKYFFVSVFIKTFMLLPLLLSAQQVSLYSYELLSSQFGYMRLRLPREIVIGLYTAALFIVSDFTRYWLHRLLHTVPVLWRFHKVHHSAKVLTPFTFYRVHPVENLLFGFRYALSIGTVTGVFLFLFGAMIDIHTVLGVNIFIFIFSLLGSNLRHSHIPLRYPGFLEYLFISPRQHQIHHSSSHFDKNYGGYLAIWDLIFGSLQRSLDTKILRFGLHKTQMRSYTTLRQLLLTPFTRRTP